jgi:hypothetical protein
VSLKREREAGREGERERGRRSALSFFLFFLFRVERADPLCSSGIHALPLLSLLPKTSLHLGLFSCVILGHKRRLRRDEDRN